METRFRAVEMLTETDIEGLAQHIKRILGLDQEARISMVQLLERMEDWLEDYIFSVLEDDEMPGMDGYTGIDQYEICLSNSTYEALNQGDPHARHTAAHELGHLMMHSRMPTGYARRAQYSRHVDPEWQADHFADVFLMPKSGVQTCESAEQVAERFSVPIDRAAIRFKEIMKQQGELFA